MQNFSNYTNAGFGIGSNIAVGKSNHYTPIQNIVTNVNALFAPYFGLVVTPGEDNQTLKIYCSQFDCDETVWKVLSFRPDGRTSLFDYVSQQGLNKVKIVTVGTCIYVYFYATDLANQQDPQELAASNPSVAALPDDCHCDPCCTENLKQLNVEEAELSDVSMFINEGVDGQDAVVYINNEIDIQNPILGKLKAIFDNTDKVKATDDLVALLGDKITLPQDYYWKAVKDQSGLESIALRRRFKKRKAFRTEIECVTSVLNIYNSNHDGIWVDPYVGSVQDRELDDLIVNILNEIHAVNTDDPCVWGLEQSEDDGVTESASEESGNVVYELKDEFGAIVSMSSSKEEIDKLAKYWEQQYKVSTKITTTKL